MGEGDGVDQGVASRGHVHGRCLGAGGGLEEDLAGLRIGWVHAQGRQNILGGARMQQAEHGDRPADLRHTV